MLCQTTPADLVSLRLAGQAARGTFQAARETFKDFGDRECRAVADGYRGLGMIETFQFAISSAAAIILAIENSQRIGVASAYMVCDEH